MKIYTSQFLNQILFGVIFVALNINLMAQEKSSKIIRKSIDTTDVNLNMDATYNRPSLTMDKFPVALGGYVEANSIYSTVDGVSEGLSFQARRLTIFMSATITKSIKFLSEIEYEDGTKEIAIEFAAIDVSFNSALNFRAGIVMNPIGAFNQNHDGPKWEFVERPDAAVNLLPATWSNVGFGMYGKANKDNWIIGYELYLTNGFDDRIIDNEENKTFLPASKENDERFEESNNGKPLFTGKIAIKNPNIGEIGISYMGGIYNKFEEEGITLDKKRRLDVFAIDWNTRIKKFGTYIVGELSFIKVDIPDTYTQQYGEKQKGFFIDIVQPILKRKVFHWNNATLNIATRLDFVDWNVGKFNETNTDIGDELWAVTPAISFRPTAQTVFRLNYRYQWQKDILNNPATKTATWLFGFSTYF